MRDALRRLQTGLALAQLLAPALEPGRQRGHDQRRRQECRDPGDIVRNIGPEGEQWRREEVVEACCRDHRQNDRYAEAAQQRDQREQNHIGKGRPAKAKAELQADEGDQCQAGGAQQELGGNGL